MKNMKIGIVGNITYKSESKIMKFIKKISDKYPDATILSGGTTDGPEHWIKKYALEFGLKYMEYNPSFTGKNLYSAMDTSYYKKEFHISHYSNRYKQLIFNSDKVVLFGVPRSFKPVIKYLQKKPFVLIN